MPPLVRISSTTWSAGPFSSPCPSSVAPRSFTTTLAPAFAIAIAMPRPIPRPEPVTSAALPSSNPIVHHLPSLSGVRHGSAVNPERLTGHHICPIGCEVDGDRAGPGGAPQPASREVAQQPLCRCAGPFDEWIALHPAQPDAVDADVCARPFERERPDQRHQPGLGGAVRGGVRDAALGQNRDDLDDAAALATRHHGAAGGAEQ